MNIRRAFMRTLLGDLIIFGLLHGILSVPLHLVYGELAFALRLPLLLPLCLGLTWLRWRLDNIVLVLLVHIAFIAWPVLVPLSLLQRAMLILFLFAYACYSLLMRLQNGWREETGGPIACIVIHAALTLLSAFLRMEAVNTIMIGWAFVTLMAYLIYLQTLRVDRALDILSGNARQPVRTILRFITAFSPPWRARRPFCASLRALFRWGLSSALWPRGCVCCSAFCGPFWRS
jgi:hypothetical protein